MASIKTVLQQTFRPEFINRIDDILLFNRLAAKDMAAIARIQLDRLAARLHRLELKLNVTDAALHWLAAHGFDETYGARPLKRLLQQEVENPLSAGILADRFAPGATVTVAVAMDKLTVT
jgi:ATP-dependent Clp protease ATP-binding subunit ClpB